MSIKHFRELSIKVARLSFGLKVALLTLFLLMVISIYAMSPVSRFNNKPPYKETPPAPTKNQPLDARQAEIKVKNLKEIQELKEAARVTRENVSVVGPSFEAPYYYFTVLRVTADETGRRGSNYGEYRVHHSTGEVEKV